MQHEVCRFLRRQAGRQFTARELSSKLNTPTKNVRNALAKLSKSGIINRQKTINTRRHFEYKYLVRRR